MAAKRKGSTKPVRKPKKTSFASAGGKASQSKKGKAARVVNKFIRSNGNAVERDSIEGSGDRD